MTSAESIYSGKDPSSVISSDEEDSPIQECKPTQTNPLLAGKCIARVSEVSIALEWALALLGCLQPLVEKPAVVFDIDGTLLKNTSGTNKTKCIL